MSNRSSLFVGLLLLFGFAACNKNSNELPPTRNRPIVFSVPITINGVPKLTVYFEQYVFTNGDSGVVQLENTGMDTTKTLDSVDVFIEICKGANKGYNSCYVLPIAKIKNLRGGAKLRIAKLSGIGKLLTEKTVTAGALNYNGTALLFSGIYEHPSSASEFLADSTYKYSSSARAYILYDGTAHIYSNAADSAQYYVTGKFNQEFAFSGSLFNGGTMQAMVSYDSITIDSNTKVAGYLNNDNFLRCNLKLARPLGDNVDHISLFLKK